MNLVLTAIVCGCYPCVLMSQGASQAPVQLEQGQALAHQARGFSAASTTFSWIPFSNELITLKELMYPGGIPAFESEEPLHRLQLLAQANATSLIDLFDTHGTPTGLTASEEIDADDLADSILELLDDEPGIISSPIELDLRQMLGDLISDLAA